MANMLVLSDIEELVYFWLIKRRIPFESQVSLRGGVFELGGSKVDFILTGSMIALRVMGEYYHRGVAAEGRDMLQREVLMGLGYIVVDLWGDDIKNRLEETMQKALLGEGML